MSDQTRLHQIARVEDVPPGERVIADVDGREVAVFNVNGEYHALLNWCPHQAGPLCEGPVGGTITAEFDRDTLETTTLWGREGEILACPWHGLEFDIASGSCLSSDEMVVPTYPVTVEDGEIYVRMR